MNPKITHDELLSILSYDPATGLFHWTVDRSPTVRAGRVTGTVNDRGYVFVRIDGRSIRAHRLAWFFVHRRWPKNSIDHIDGDKANNRLANLREATSTENARNKPCLGYSVVKNKFYMAQIKVNHRNHYLGLFKTAAEARAAYEAAALKYHGDFSAVARGGLS